MPQEDSDTCLPCSVDGTVVSRSHRLSWATDVHLNFVSTEEIRAFCDDLAEGTVDAAVITGDIAEGPSLESVLERLARHFQRPIYFVLGNHDAYRTSIREVRSLAKTITRRSPWLRWLPSAGVVELGPEDALVGVDGWADGRCGSFERSPVALNDYVAIEELAGLSKASRLWELHHLGDEQAEILRAPLQTALSRYKRVVVATHVPPFREACWHEGEISDDHWLPHFTCIAVGDVLREAATMWPDREILVICGHTHGEGTAEILPNLRVITGGATYGDPRVQGVIERGRLTPR